MSTNARPLRDLGRTGLRVPDICLGGAALGDMPETFAYSVDAERALATIRAIFDGPIPFLDTAAAYGDGKGERRIGAVIRERGGLPAGFVLATKADRNLTTGDFSGEQIKRSVEGSLERLELDRLELVYLHDPEHTTFEATMAPGGPIAVLREYQTQGIIAHLGISGGPISMMTRYVETDLFTVAESHNRYTLLNNSASPFWDVCTRHGVAAINAAPYGSGMLAKGPSAYPRYAYQDADPDLIERATRLEEICRRHAVPLAAAALQFSLRDPRITSTVVGITRPERIAQTVELANFPIPDALWTELATVPPSTDDPEEHRFS